MRSFSEMDANYWFLKETSHYTSWLAARSGSQKPFWEPTYIWPSFDLSLPFIPILLDWKQLDWTGALRNRKVCYCFLNKDITCIKFGIDLVPPIFFVLMKAHSPLLTYWHLQAFCPLELALATRGLDFLH